MASKLRKKLIAMQAALEAETPSLFSLLAPVPFKIGIFKEILAKFPEAEPGIVHSLMAWMTDRRAYLRACQEGAPRFGFAGPEGEVTQKDAVYAAARLKEREEKAAAITAHLNELKARKEAGRI